jgi:dienelactone hydrolase
MSDADHGATAAAADAMDQLSTDPRPDTEAHLSLSPTRDASPDDSTRADLLLLQIRDALRKYADVRVAAADGFEELPASEGKHTIHHLSNWSWAGAEARRFDPAHPTSLLYREGLDGTLGLIGAMYTAPANSSMADLDRRIPVGLARWHRHINWCAPKSGSGAQWLTLKDGAPAYGPRSPVTTRDACEAAGGTFYPGIFGWMAHVTFVGSDDPRIVWNGALPPGGEDSAAVRDTTTDRAHALQVASEPSGHTAPRRRDVPITLVTVPSPTRSPAEPVPSPVAAASHAAPSPEVSPASTPSARVAEPPPAISASEPRPSGVVPHPPDRPDPTVLAAGGRVSGTFMSGHRPIAFDRFAPSSPGAHSAILLLHGDGGLPLQADHFEELATALSRRGYFVEIVHYFDRTGTLAADQTQRMVHFHDWEVTIRDALSDVAHAPGVDSTRLGIFGTGLGASLALAVGAQDRRVQAVAEYEGSMPVWAVATVRRMPAVFIGQSDADPPLAVREANRIQAICESVKAPAELEVYAAPNHKGRGTGITDLRQRTAAFLDKYLKGDRP